MAASRIATETRKYLGEESFDTTLSSAFSLLLNLVRTCQSSGMPAALSEANLPAEAGNSAFSLSVGIADRLRDILASEQKNRALSEITVRAFQTAIVAAVSERSPSLFTNSPGDIQKSIADYAKPQHFSSISQLVFSSFLSGVTEFVASKHVPDIQGNPAISSEIRSWASKVSSITSEYSQDWFAKHLIHSDKPLSQNQVESFASYGIKKLWKAMAKELHGLEDAQ